MLYYKVVKVFEVEFKMWPFYGFSWGELTERGYNIQIVTASFNNTPADEVQNFINGLVVCS